MTEVSDGHATFCRRMQGDKPQFDRKQKFYCFLLLNVNYKIFNINRLFLVDGYLFVSHGADLAVAQIKFQ